MASYSLKYRNMGDLRTLMRAARIALTPRGALISQRIGSNVRIWGENREGHGIRGVYLYGDRYEGGLSLLKHFLSPGDNFIDIGANIGIYSLVASEIVGKDGVVVAVEPFVATAARLSHNVLYNDAQNVRIRVTAVSSDRGYADLHMNGDRPVSFSLVSDNNGSSKKINVPITTIDDLVQSEGLKSVRYLKLDVEGVEREVLNGAKETLKLKPIVQYETANGDAFSDLLPGYKMFRSVDTKGRQLDINVLAIHEDDPHLEKTCEPCLRLVEL